MKIRGKVAGAALIASLISASIANLRAQTSPSAPADERGRPWSVGIGGGYIRYEGDEPTRDSGFVFLRLGCDYSPRWTFRGDIVCIPYLGSNLVYNYSTGVPVPRDELRADSTWAAGASADALFHLLPEGARRWDPYLIGGIGLLAYADTRDRRSRVDVPVRAGAGVAFHFDNGLSFNLDLMAHMTIDKTEFNFIPSAGLAWKWGAAGAAGLGAAAFASPPPAETVIQSFELDMNIDRTAWRPEYLPELEAIASAILAHPDSAVRIEGHIERRPDYSETEALNLTQTRAESVRDYLVEKYRIDRRRIAAAGYGFSRPKTSDGAAPENRRMEIHIISKGR